MLATNPFNKQRKRSKAMEIEVPKGTALVVFVGKEGDIIEAVHPEMKRLRFGAGEKDTLIGGKFAVGKQSAATGTGAAAKAVTYYCCWRYVGGRWVCRPEYC
jgi:hypothetical protein